MTSRPRALIANSRLLTVMIGLLLLVAVFIIQIMAWPAMAHIGGKSKPKVKITKESPSVSVRLYTVILTDSDSPEPIPSAKVLLTANMTEPHPMSIEPIGFKPGDKEGVYKARVEFPMPGKWQMVIDISGANIAQTKSAFLENMESQVSAEKPGLQPSTPVQSSVSVKAGINWLSVIFSIIHLIFGVLWVGSHAFVVLALRPFIIEPPGKKFLQLVMKRYSAIASLSLVLLVVSGIYNAIFNAPAPVTVISSKPLGSLYLGLLIGKIGLVGLAFLVGIYSAVVIAPKLSQDVNSKERNKMARSLLAVATVNLVLGLAILVLAATLGQVHLIMHQV